MSTVDITEAFKETFKSSKLKLIKTRDDAVIPETVEEASGLDLTLIDIHKRVVNGVVMYTTGLKMIPPDGYYGIIVPRSSIIKTNYTMANGMGIIDANYRGELIVPVRKVYNNTPDLPLPSKLFQLVLMPLITINVIEATEDSIQETARGAGGFGSTNVKETK